ncbi:MAG TPA: ATP-binding cassette domain-containing protein [Solirubrobacteraceae bacterium]|jgi:putative ABC transport system ATP-binding protein|nr:ATP-binding cassette domain-containing protein [Solirubrobacteraceae bacterium]
MSRLLGIREISKAYPDGGGYIGIFERASMEIAEGAHVGVYGKRHSGKSTLLRIAAGIERPDSGSVRFEDLELTAATPGQLARLLRSRLAYVSVADWHPNAGESVAQHLALSLGGDGLTVRQAQRRALRELEAVGVGAAEAHSSALGLSLIDRSRVMIARAFAHDPRLIVIDDPVLTPSVTERDRLYAMLRGLARERDTALLVASEDFAALQGFDVFVSISAGELCSSEGNATVVPFPTSARLGAARDASSR